MGEEDSHRPLAGKDIPSLRRQLDALEEKRTQLLDENEDLSHKSRLELEQEVRHLRREINKTVMLHIDVHEAVRDLISHSVGKNNEDYLHLNRTTEKVESKESLSDILARAGRRALGGGLPGAAAMGLQVLSLMWLRTTINYQYANGTSTTVALRTLYRQGGIPRFYAGLLPALFQGPLSRFGDTAANSGTLALLNSYDSTRDLPVAVKTVFASSVAAGWRIFLMPIDTTKTIMQVNGSNGIPTLVKKVRTGGPTVLYHGALAASGATFAGHFPWFFTHNLLQEKIPQPDTLGLKLARNGLIGFCSSLVSDTVSNSIRVTKVYKQTSNESISYPVAVKEVIAKDGLSGLFFRGLQTRILANGCQGMLFTVLWKLMEEKFNSK